MKIDEEHRADFAKRAGHYGVPEHDVDGLFLYVFHGIMPGSFLEAVLSNDLMESFGRADHINKEKIFNICQFIYNEIPSDCWGSPEKMQAWMDARQVAVSQPAEPPGGTDA